MPISKWGALALVVLTTACASVKIQKIRSGTEMDEAVGPNGIRFYLPRPYVVVNEPFVVGSDVYLIRGHLTSDSQYVLLDDADTELLRKLEKFFPTDRNRELEIPAGKVLIPAEVPPDRGGPQGTSDDEGEETETETEAEPPTEDEDAGTGEQPPPEQPDKPEPEKDQQQVASDKKTGVISTKVENDPNAFSLTPLKRYFDIAWLPDFDEQYVVRGKAGLGNASILVRLGQGWSLQGLETTADNAALAGPLAEVWGDAVKSLYALAKAKYKLPSAFTPGGPQGAGDEARTLSSAPGGIPVTIKLTIAQVAAPGVYPILKPKELACLTNSTGKHSLTCLPADDYEDHEGEVLLPVPPLTQVAYNVYQLIVLEAAKPMGDSITGIERYFDFRGGGGAATSSETAALGKIDETVLDDVQQDINEQQKAVPNRWEIQSIRPKADGSGKLQVEVKKVGNPDENKQRLLADAIAAELGERGHPINSSNIEVVERS